MSSKKYKILAIIILLLVSVLSVQLLSGLTITIIGRGRIETTSKGDGVTHSRCMNDSSEQCKITATFPDEK